MRINDKKGSPPHRPTDGGKKVPCKQGRDSFPPGKGGKIIPVHQKPIKPKPSGK